MKTGDDFKKELVAELKAEGLDLAEESVASLVKVFFRLLPKIPGLIKNPIVSMIVGFLVKPIKALEFKVLIWVDKIDGKVG